MKGNLDDVDEYNLQAHDIYIHDCGSVYVNSCNTHGIRMQDTGNSISTRPQVNSKSSSSLAFQLSHKWVIYQITVPLPFVRMNSYL